MPSNQIILLTPPSQLDAAQKAGVPLGVMGYRLKTGGHLLRSAHAGGKGGWLVVDDVGFDGEAPLNPNQFLQEIHRECNLRGYSGVIANWEGAPSDGLRTLTARLDEGLSARRVPLFVTERWGKCAPNAKVMISSALSGGSLRTRLEEAQSLYGAHRIALAIERSAEEFLLPAPTGSGIPLTQEELKRRREQYRPATYFSSQLCAHYFTWQSRDGRAHFVLFDNESSIQKKIQVAQKLGVTTFFMAYPEVADLLPGVLH